MDFCCRPKMGNMDIRKMPLKNPQGTPSRSFPKMKFYYDPITSFVNARVHYFERSSCHLEPLSRALMTGL